jgi:hypothetical protein
VTDQPPRSATPDDIEAALSDLRADLGVPPPDDDASEHEPPDPGPVAPKTAAEKQVNKQAERRRRSWLGQGMLLIIAAGIGGGVTLMAPGLLGVTPPAGQDAQQRFDEIDARIARLSAATGGAAAEAAYRDLAAKVAGLERRLGALELRPAAAPATPGGSVAQDGALTERVGGLEAGLAGLGQRLSALEERIAAIATPPPPTGAPAVAAGPDVAAVTVELQALQDGLSALEARLVAVETGVPARELVTQLDRRISELEDTNPGRAARNATMSLVLTRLAEAADSGRPFSAELAALKQIAPAMADLSAVEPFAASGLPPAAALAAQLQGLDAAVRDAADADRGGDWLTQFLRSLSRLIVITTDADPVGDEPEDRLVRAQRRAAAGDIGQAVAELEGLSGSARQTVEPWLAAALARLALSAAIGQITNAILRDLTQAAP